MLLRAGRFYSNDGYTAPLPPSLPVSARRRNLCAVKRAEAFAASMHTPYFNWLSRFGPNISVLI
jgi:hypothetical protein